MINEVKQGFGSFVVGWETAWELWIPKPFVQRHLATVDCSTLTDCAEVTAILRLEPLLAWIVSKDCLQTQTRLLTEIGRFTWCGELLRVGSLAVAVCVSDM